MAEDAYVEVSFCLGAALVDLLSGVTDFSTVDAFRMVLEAGLILVLVNLIGAGGGMREPIGSNRSFQVMPTLRIVLAAL